MLYSKDARVEIRIYKNFTSPADQLANRTKKAAWEGPAIEVSHAGSEERVAARFAKKRIFSVHEHISFLEALAGRPQLLMTRRY